MTKEQLLTKIKEALIEMEEDLVVDLSHQSLKMGIDPRETIDLGLIAGMNEVGRLFEEEEYFLPEVLICSDALNQGLDILKPHLKKSQVKDVVKVVIGVVEGDTHDIGKNLVKIMMETAGFEVHDLGRDVPLNKFIDTIEEINGHILCMSTLMTTTMNGMKIVIDQLNERGIRDKYKVMVGGGPLSKSFADSIGADLYTKDANEAVRKAKELLSLA